MRSRLAFALILLLSSSAAIAKDQRPSRGVGSSRSLLEQIVRLSNEGFSDETILVYVDAHRAELPPLLTDNDLIWLRRSGVSESLIREVVRMVEGDEERQAYATYDSDDSEVVSLDSYVGSSYPYPDSFYGSYYPYYGSGYFSYPSAFFLDIHHGFFGHHGIGHHVVGHHSSFGHRGSFGGHGVSHSYGHRLSGRSGLGHSFSTHRATSIGHHGTPSVRAGHGVRTHGSSGGAHQRAGSASRSAAGHSRGGHSSRGHSGGGHSGGGHGH